jgi:hypothetical protein
MEELKGWKIEKLERPKTNGFGRRLFMVGTNGSGFSAFSL